MFGIKNRTTFRRKNILKLAEKWPDAFATQLYLENSLNIDSAGEYRDKEIP